jgi:lipopolysaccharide export system protein LptC
MTAHPGNLNRGNARRNAVDTSREAAFQRAARHSRKVRILKILLPVSAVLIAGAFLAYSYVRVPGQIAFDISESSFVDGKLVMANPRLEGFTRDDRPYSMAARRALQHVDQTGIVELEGIDATLPVSRDTSATIVAEHGVYNREDNTLEVQSPISVSTTDGLTASFQSAFVDIDEGVLRTDQPVVLQIRGGELSADSMSVAENGKVVVFENRVRVEIRLDRLREHSVGKDEE